MAEDTAGSIPKRVFINSVDSYASRNIAKFLSERRLVSTYEEDETEEQERAFQLVGSADRRDGGSPHVLEVYSKANRDELLLKLMQCDVIIYNISEHADQVEEALWAVSEKGKACSQPEATFSNEDTDSDVVFPALHGQMEQFAASKMFILISTVMTWALTEPLDPEDPTLPLTDELFWRRRPHPNFKSHCELEKRVVKLGKINKRVFSTYVVASGCLYGKGEQFLHYFFKTAWLGGQHEILLFGDGNNVIPMIHVIDLASVIQNVIEQPPLPGYLLAVDNSDNTLEEIVKMVASVLGSGTIQKKPFEEAFLIPDFSVMEIDALQLNLYMDSVYVKELLSVKWMCESGLVENIELVVEEYRQSRQLLPIRVCVLGPPAVGKSTVSKHICQQYKLHYISLEESISQLDAAMDNPDEDEEDDDSLEETRMLLSRFRESRDTGTLAMDPGQNNWLGTQVRDPGQGDWSRRLRERRGEEEERRGEEEERRGEERRGEERRGEAQSTETHTKIHYLCKPLAEWVSGAGGHHAALKAAIPVNEYRIGRGQKNYTRISITSLLDEERRGEEREERRGEERRGEERRGEERRGDLSWGYWSGKLVWETDTLDEQFKVKVVRDRLLSKPCRNQGFVLDNFPVTRDQARELFSADGDNSEEPEEAPISSCSRRITPEFVFYLDASEEFLKARVKNLPESLIQEQDYQQEAFLQRLATFRMSRLKNETALEYFEEIDVAPVLLEVTSNEKLDTTLLMHKVFETIGQPRNYQLSPEVGQDKEEEKRVGKTGHEDALPSLWEKGCGEEDKQKAEGAGKWITRLEKVKLYEDKQLEAQSVPVRNYLMEHVMPTLTQGLIQCCRSQPQDPVDFLAEYLLRNNPFNS
ncbi:Adenylate kinase 7 [Takifugu flavidus]|uniref:Adenylate kinase 7 n=1 Tax=Takifugu flavidus TaxID=433684 RepID=A0A5C6NXL8_9TELE|nr:Adenylate kinase 7 [Takifugu flavidus]